MKELNTEQLDNKELLETNEHINKGDTVQNVDHSVEDNVEDTAEDKFEALDIGLVKEWISTEDGKRLLQPKLDKNFAKGLETWKLNNLGKEVEKEIEKRFPSDPVKAELLQMKLEILRRDIQEMAMKQLEQSKIPVGFSKFFIGQDVESTSKSINEFTQHFNSAVKKEVDERLKGFASTPVYIKNSTGNTMTKNQLLEMDYDSRAKLYLQNPEEFQRIMND